MNEEKAIAIVKDTLPLKRFEHTMRVVDVAEKLAKQYDVDVAKARLAAILHDYAKYRPIEEMQETVKMVDELPKDLLEAGGEILHAFVGAYYVKSELRIDDEDILLAIRYHTTGRDNMTKLEKVVFLADYIEPMRSFPGVETVREKAAKNLDQACLQALKNMITFLVGKNAFVYKDTFDAYNYFVKITSRRV